MRRFVRRTVFLPTLLLITFTAYGQEVSQTDTTQAGRLFAEARTLIKEANYEHANERLRRAAEQFRLARRWSRTAESYNLLSANFRILSRLDSSAVYAQKAIDLLDTEAVAAWDTKAIAYSNLGLVETDDSNFRDAIDLFEKALELAGRESVTIQTRATLLGNLGSVYDEQGDFDRALEYYNQGIKLLNGSGTDKKEHKGQLARLYNYIGITHRKKGQFDKALQFYERELQINIDLYGEGHPSVARGYNNIGGIYYYRDDFGQAAIYFRRAAESTELIFGEMHPRVGLLYNNVGAVYYEQGDYEQAVEYLEKSAAIKKETQGENHPDLALTYNNIGSIYTEMDEYETAIDYLQRSLEIRKKTLGENHPILSNNYNSLGLLHLNTKDTDRAIEYFQQSLDITLRSRGGAHPYAAEARTNLAKAYRAKGEFLEAMKYLDSAEEVLTLDRPSTFPRGDTDMSIPYRHPTYTVDVLHQKGITYYKQYESEGEVGALTSAIDTYTRLSALLDVIQLSFQNEESKLLMGSQSHRIYEDALKVAFVLYQETGREGYLEEMFFFSEKSKSRVILELLNTREAKKFAGIPDSLVVYENKLRQDLSDLQQSLSSADMSEPDASKGKERVSLQDSLFTLNRQLSTHLSLLEEQYPKYHAFKYRSDVPSAGQVRSRYFRRGNGAVLEYFYGGEESYAMVITPEEMHAVQLPHVSDLPQKIAKLNGALSQKQDSTYLRLAHQMYEALIEPVEPFLEEERVLLVPDGALNLVPFDALLTRRVENPGSFTKLPYLLNSYRFSYTPSVSLSAYMGIDEERQYREKLIAYAPVFSDFSQSKAQQVSSREGWESLPSTRFEVEEIVKYLNEERGLWSSLTGAERSEALTGHRATEANFKSGALSNYRYLHLATHAFTSDAGQKRSGIAFFPGGTGEEDGILYAEEIYGLDLNNELVVLSACETGTGEVRAGEGIIGLSRAFQYAGARNLLVSLWNVEDRSTAQLMIAFYEQLQEGKDKAAALQSAKQSLIRSGSYAHPRYWAPFVFIGE